MTQRSILSQLMSAPAQENAEQAVREMLQQFSEDRGLPEVRCFLKALLQ